VIEVPLSSRKYPGLVALVDDADHERVSRYTWWPLKTHCGTTYAWTRVEGRTTLLHRFILPAEGKVDHKDGDGLNCQHGNLRPATDQQQMQNRVKAHGPVKKPKYKGIYSRAQHTRGRAWIARLHKDGKTRYLGAFFTPEEAAMAYDTAAREAYGEYACTNFGGER
jgi:hypothetical protein